MTILTVRLSPEEAKILEVRARKRGLKKASFVRELIRQTTLETGSEVLEELEKFRGTGRLKIKKGRY